MEPLLHKGKEHHCGATVAHKIGYSLLSHCGTKLKIDLSVPDTVPSA